MSPVFFFLFQYVCSGHGGHLASAHNAEENQFIVDLIDGTDACFPYAWLGGRLDSQGNCFWEDGSEFDFQDWALCQPSKSCQRLASGNQLPG
ncbi:ladderlectin-like [Polypterus senegalus]|uniref:ladderlectin-like n=1 Tax=Polypterus senegalus TaxID=55291 RepID=UPI0019655D38|nr:ladderlectin-like [Polypterus senegalus]